MGLFDWFKTLASGKDADRHDVPANAGDTRVAEPDHALEDDPDAGLVAGLNFKTAIDAHMLWKSRLKKVIDGTNSEQLDVDTVSRDDKCVLGKWINGPGREKFGALREFQELKMDHAHFHLAAGDILACAFAGDTEGAEHRLNTGEYTRISERVKLHLARLYIQISGKNVD